MSIYAMPQGLSRPEKADCPEQTWLVAPRTERLKMLGKQSNFLVFSVTWLGRFPGYLGTCLFINYGDLKEDDPNPACGPSSGF